MRSDGAAPRDSVTDLPSATRAVLHRTPTGPASVLALAALYEVTARTLEAVFDEPVVPTISDLLGRIDSPAVFRAVSPLWRGPVLWSGVPASIALGAALVRRGRPSGRPVRR